MKMSKPIVGIPADVKQVGIHPFHAVGEKYINAVARGAGCMPVLLPAMGAGTDLEDLHQHVALSEIMSGLDGLFLPGSSSNVDPSIYGQPLLDPDSPSDSQRDATTLEMIRIAVDEEIPLFAVCRGFQEMNVAFGGTLHQAVHSVERYMDHREDPSQPRELQYAASHDIEIMEGGFLDGLLGHRHYTVNSIHGQGIETLADGLTAEAVAPDGLVEACSVSGSSSFALGIQWHAEWRYWEDELSTVLFRSFGEAAAVRHQDRC